MSEVWSDIAMEDLAAAQSDDRIFMTCTLQLTSRATGAVIRQPFAEVLRFDEGLLLDGTPYYFDTAEIVREIQ
ncbi:hypothetical protein [Rhizobium lentis]|uniref:hypothetical protein n=1 Tax=Rhizobium lentis TaxID=1138194 RepID=UPI001FE3F2E0|nr:hypothetical protein [Rhizobium lentis]